MPRCSKTNASATITITRGDLEYMITVSGDYTPGRPPPPCSDHDHPNFSDPGDGPEFEHSKVEIEEVTDEEGEIVAEGHVLFGTLLKPEQIDLTREEEDKLYEALDVPYNEGPDPDEEYERWRDRQDDDC